MNDQTKRILIIDDHQLFADGLRLILNNLGENTEVCVCDDGLQALSDRKVILSFDLILVDLNMPKFSGFGFLMAVQAQHFEVDVAVVSGNVKKHEIERALHLGAKGFIPKDSESSEMLRAVSELLEGKRYLPTHWEGKVDWLPSGETKKITTDFLTERQIQVLRLMSEGMQNKQIAVALGISVSSVKGHVELLFKNLSVNNRTACVQTANDLALI